jgi:hypothetical protein
MPEVGGLHHRYERELLDGPSSTTDQYHEVAATVGTSAGAIKSAIHGVRARFGGLLRSPIAETVASGRDRR